MTTTAPLLFAEILHSPGLWKALGKTHDLSEKDFRWLAHIALPTHALRSAQTPPLFAESVLLNVDKEPPVPLAGAFILSATPDEHAHLLYTPYDGIKKYDSRASLKEALEKRLKGIDEENRLLAFMAFSLRRRVVDAEAITLTWKTIEGEVFDAQKDALLHMRQLNAHAMVDELQRVPSLTLMLEQALDKWLEPSFGKLAQRHTRASLYTLPDPVSEPDQTSRYWLDSMSLSEAVLMFYRQAQWPANQQHEFSNPGKTPAKEDQAKWEQAVIDVASKLPALLFEQLENYWDAPSTEGTSRRGFFAKALASQARTELLLKREAEIITTAQFNTLHLIIQPITESPRPTIETVHVWEHEANYVEPAGSLMLGDTQAFLYTPSSGLQVLADYQDLKDTVLSKFRQRGHEDEMYALLSLDERMHFQGFDQPNVSGERIAGDIFQILFEAIITKQRANILYALQVFRHSEGAVDIHALFDKALDIRAMVHEQLLTLDSHGRWSTRPVFSGVQQPSSVLADSAALAAKTYTSVTAQLDKVFSAQPNATADEQRIYLNELAEKWADALSLGIRAEVKMRRLQGSLTTLDKAIVETVFDATDRSRRARNALNGFRPDAYAITLQVPGVQQLLPLAGCFFLTERGGLDEQHSGRAIIWTASMGLECFDNLRIARQALSRRLQDSAKRQVLLENLAPAQWRAAQHYELGPMRLIEEDLLNNRVKSAIEHCLAHAQQQRERIKDSNQQAHALKQLKRTAHFTNLPRAAELARALHQQQTLPAWLGMAPLKEQQLHLELLEQWHNSVSDNKDYLDGVPGLTAYVKQRLKSLLGARFPGEHLDPGLIEVTPDLALAGPARSLADFALNHINVAQATGFKVASKTPKALPASLDQQAVRQLLLSLNIASTYAAKVSETLSEASSEGIVRRQRFLRQLPWQLLQHAHALKLQQQLSDRAFDFICQVLDMPDALARSSVTGAHAQVLPLSLIKTAGADAVKTLGLYVIRPGSDHSGPLVLYAPYAETVFQEFENATALIAALNTPGALQELLLRRLPASQQTGFRNLLQSSIGETSEMTLATHTLSGNLLGHLFNDNLRLLKQFLGCQAQSHAQADWEAVKNLLGEGIKRVAGLLPGKLAYVPFLWQAYKDFKDSAEDLQNHHWKRGLRSFIDGAVGMVSFGRLALDDETAKKSPVTATDKEKALPAPSKKFTPDWKDIKPTAPLRTQLQPFEAKGVALADMSHDAQKAIYLDLASKKTYAAIDGKVVRVKKNGAAWHLYDGKDLGPGLRKQDDVLILDPNVRTIRTGKALSKLRGRDNSLGSAHEVLNIQARGMKEIRRRHPEKAWMLVQAVDLAQFYAFNSLHNLAQMKNRFANSRLETFFKSFFDVPSADTSLLGKIHEAIVPICNALVDPTNDLINTDRFVIGSSKFPQARMAAFVLDDTDKDVHFTERFFETRLDWYKTRLIEPFNVDGHAQAATLIHEFAHLVSKAEDIAMVEARRPFADLISTTTAKGLELKQAQQEFQREALSLATPREQLFKRWDSEDQQWISLDKVEGLAEAAACRGILEATVSPTLAEARNAFLDQNTPDARIRTILRNADSVAMLICEMGRQLDV
ncbi:dermonecrotic toxin domain-containing protein [Pseudomonas sp. PB106]|uniref:dermonecrotic toxin domain-containing protein n=1 Tax=Pseudomonas sp. PB106 TaxID=2494699 RepID=UPI00131DBCF4|nr:DUF6543 domain-containing protein [Pseudomonas sp. PB106]KAE9646368.1 hypothetical protein EJA71_09625 [Pseudomonas sp. PB106]